MFIIPSNKSKTMDFVLQAMGTVCFCFCWTRSCLMKHRFVRYVHFCVPHWMHAYLDTNVVVLFFSHLHKDSKQGEDRACAEEGALGPNHRRWEEDQQNCQQLVETLPEHTLPVPLWEGHTHTHTPMHENKCWRNSQTDISVTHTSPHMAHTVLDMDSVFK